MRATFPHLKAGFFLLFIFFLFRSPSLRAGDPPPFTGNGLLQDSTGKEVRGTVTDSTGPVSGVTVSVKGRPGIGTQTDNNGKYILQVPASTTTLEFSIVGYTAQEQTISGRAVINVVMAKGNAQLNEVVVTAFGNKQKKTDVVGSVTSIKPGELKIPSSNLTTALAGKLSGVIAYQRSGEPGADNAEFFIRGVNTFGYKVDPLILIDNLEVTKDDFARLTTEDIATFSIMKDATATALYGARGANGVILVTTKEGKDGKARINLRVDNSISQATKNVELADPITYMKLHNEAVLTRDPLGVLPYTAEKIDNTVPGSGSFAFPATDWRDMIIRPSTMNQRGHLDVSGGGKVAQYYVAGSFSQDNGILRVNGQNDFNSNIKLKTYQLRSNTNIKLTPATELIIRLSGIFDEYNGPIPGGTGVYRNIMRTNPVLFPAYYPKDADHDYVDHIMFGNYESGNYLNPYAEMVKGYKDYSKSSMSATFEVKQNLEFITRGLAFDGFASTNRYSYFDINRYYNPFYYKLLPGSYDRKTGAYSVDVINPLSGTEYLNYNEGPKQVSSIFHFQSTLTYNRIFDKKHSIGGLLVFIARNSLTGNAGTLQTSLPSRNAGLSGRATYGYDSRYFVEFNFGYNGSERFSETERYGFFPSAGVAWMVSNEDWFKKDWIVSKLKFRATYGLVGNDQIGSPTDRFFYLSNVNMSDAARKAVFGENLNNTLNGISVSRYENRDITWETAHKANFGADISLFNNKIEIIADYFMEHRYNILMDRTSIPTTMGLSAVQRANLGEASSHGFDMSIDVNHTFSNNLWLAVRGNFTYAVSRNEVYEEPQYNEKYLSRVGYPINQTWGYIAERLFIDDAEVANSPAQVFGGRPAMAGDIKYVDVNGDGQITTLDRVPIGYPTVPQIIYGFGFSSGFHKFDLSAFFQGSARSSFWIDPAATAPFVRYTYSGETVPSSTVLQNQLLKAYADDHWSEDNRNPYALWPRLDNQANSNNNQTNTWFMRNGSFLRLKQLEVGYTLPKSILYRLHMQNCRFYFSGTNLLTFTSFRLWDIEQAGKGLEYPVQKVYNFGVQLNF